MQWRNLTAYIGKHRFSVLVRHYKEDFEAWVVLISLECDAEGWQTPKDEKQASSYIQKRWYEILCSLGWRLRKPSGQWAHIENFREQELLELPTPELRRRHLKDQRPVYTEQLCEIAGCEGRIYRQWPELGWVCHKHDDAIRVNDTAQRPLSEGLEKTRTSRVKFITRRCLDCAGGVRLRASLLVKQKTVRCLECRKLAHIGARLRLTIKIIDRFADLVDRAENFTELCKLARVKYHTAYDWRRRGAGTSKKRSRDLHQRFYEVVKAVPYWRDCHRKLVLVRIEQFGRLLGQGHCFNAVCRILDIDVDLAGIWMRQGRERKGDKLHRRFYETVLANRQKSKFTPKLSMRTIARFRAYLSQGESFLAACRLTGVSTSNAYEWLNRGSGKKPGGMILHIRFFEMVSETRQKYKRPSQTAKPAQRQSAVA